jgi:hypothetical protein
MLLKLFDRHYSSQEVGEVKSSSSSADWRASQVTHALNSSQVFLAVKSRVIFVFLNKD